MLVRLVYASRSTTPITPELVNDILAQSRRHNEETGITGVLCVCHGDVFMQVLEGGREEVNRLYGKLLRDPRHADVVLLEYAEIVERRFYSWRMGRVDVDRLNPGVILRYGERTTLDPYRISGKVAVALLEELMNTASIVA
jgi:hypothetical protein